MHRRFFAPLLLALVLAAGFHVSTAARGPRFLSCDAGDRGEILIVIENFGGMGGAVQHCVHFWQGHPRGVVQ